MAGKEKEEQTISTEELKELMQQLKAEKEEIEKIKEDLAKEKEDLNTMRKELTDGMTELMAAKTKIEDERTKFNIATGSKRPAKPVKMVEIELEKTKEKKGDLPVTVNGKVYLIQEELKLWFQISLQKC